MDRFHGPAAMVAWIVVSVALWAICLPGAWALVNLGHVAFTAATRFPAELGGTLFSYAYGGIFPLVAALPAVVMVGRARPEIFRAGAVGISVLLGSWLGFYLVHLDDPVIQAVMLAWLAFGALVPRPPGPGSGPGST